MLCVSEMMARAAMLREESRGAHYRLDHPERDDKDWMVNVRISSEHGKMVLSKLPIVDIKEDTYG
jgi:succinate dehydrogenase/fumarate reductase flavoprotein subunit